MRLSYYRMVSCSVSLWAVLWTFAVVFFLSLLGGFNCQPFVLDGAHLSPRGFQLPTFCAGWFSTPNLSCWLVLIRCNLSFSSGVSAAILLVHGYFCAVIFLSPQAFQLPFFHIRGYFSAGCSLASLSSAVSAASLYLHVVAE